VFTNETVYFCDVRFFESGAHDACRSVAAAVGLSDSQLRQKSLVNVTDERTMEKQQDKHGRVT